MGQVAFRLSGRSTHVIVRACIAGWAGRIVDGGAEDTAIRSDGIRVYIERLAGTRNAAGCVAIFSFARSADGLAAKIQAASTKRAAVFIVDATLVAISRVAAFVLGAIFGFGLIGAVDTLPDIITVATGTVVVSRLVGAFDTLAIPRTVTTTTIGVFATLIRVTTGSLDAGRTVRVGARTRTAAVFILYGAGDVLLQLATARPAK